MASSKLGLGYKLRFHQSFKLVRSYLKIRRVLVSWFISSFVRYNARKIAEWQICPAFARHRLTSQFQGNTKTNKQKRKPMIRHSEVGEDTRNQEQDTGKPGERLLSIYYTDPVTSSIHSEPRDYSPELQFPQSYLSYTVKKLECMLKTWKTLGNQ